MNQVIFDKLHSFTGSGKLISVYADATDPQSFAVGFLIQINSDNILLNMVNRAGEETGFYLFSTNDIFRFSYEEKYFEKIEKLFSIKKQKIRKISNLKSNLVVSLLDYADQNHLLVEVNDDPTGYVKSIAGGTLELELIDNCGNRIGISNIDLSIVKSIRCQSKYLNDIELLVNCTKR